MPSPAPSPVAIANVPPILEYLRSMSTLAPFATGVGMGWGACVYWKKERTDILLERLRDIQKRHEACLEELKMLTQGLRLEQEASAQLRANQAHSAAKCPICGGPVVKAGALTGYGDGMLNSNPISLVVLLCKNCNHEFRVAASTLSSRI